jgi:hypothetical protein
MPPDGGPDRAQDQLPGRGHRPGHDDAPRREQSAWPRYASGRLMSLRPGNQSQTISAVTYGAEHQCSFWNAG